MKHVLLFVHWLPHAGIPEIDCLQFNTLVQNTPHFSRKPLSLHVSPIDTSHPTLPFLTHADAFIFLRLLQLPR